MSAWIEETNNCFTVLPIYTGNVTALKPITVCTGKAEIRVNGKSPMLFSDDVINFEGKELIHLTYSTVFSAVLCTFNYLSSQRCADIG